MNFKVDDHNPADTFIYMATFCILFQSAMVDLISHPEIGFRCPVGVARDRVVAGGEIPPIEGLVVIQSIRTVNRHFVGELQRAVHHSHLIEREMFAIGLIGLLE